MQHEQWIKETAQRLWVIVQEVVPQSSSEADFRRRIDPEIEEFCKKISLTTTSIHSEMRLASGRADAVFNRFVIEYERPGTLSAKLSDRGTRHAVGQLKRYTQDLAQQARQDVHRVAGVAFDGYYLVFVRYVEGEFIAEPPTPVNRESLERMLTWLAALMSGVALTSDNLARDFGIEQLRTQKTLRAFYHGLKQAMPQSGAPTLVAKLFEQWRILFSEAIDYSEAFGSGKLANLQKWAKKAGFTIASAFEAEQFFFVLHTYFALLVKLIARMAVMRAFMDKLAPPSYDRLASLPSDQLRQELEQIESGDLFRKIGIQNLLEGDFFSWYLHAWNNDTEQAIREVLRRLGEYDPNTLSMIPEETRDLFKKLYHYLLPREVRHNLGEYYTPDWLAERLLTQMDNELFDPPRQPNEQRLRKKVLTTRFLDPACGSGTFLVLILGQLQRLGKQLIISEPELLEALTRNVVGFDINPLAVLTARVNYLLAIADLLPYRKGEIALPVYLADSVQMPAFSENLMTGSVYLFPTSVGVFQIPTEFCNAERFDPLCALIEECVQSETSEQAFVQRAMRLLPAPATEEVVPYHGIDEQGKPIREIPEYLKQLCREARAHPTPAEAFLWECVRDRRLNGLKFRRQHAIGRYIADFYCHEARLIVELEGAVHDEPQQAAYDAVRFETLESQGFRVLRIRNEALRQDPEKVLTMILEAALGAHPHPQPVSHPHPQPLSQRERGVDAPSPYGRGGQGGEGAFAAQGGEEAFAAQGGEGIPPWQRENIAHTLRETYHRLLELHQQGLNGLWARVLKNNFAPLTVGQFDYIVGNPPWVNWEHLPDNYRDSIRKLWTQYKLPPERGGGRLGAVKGDLSALMTLVVADKLLKRGGKLGFVITQSLFKTAAGAGFRRFKLPDGTPLHILHVDDMVELNPFEGASNRTAVMVLQKGQETRYPVPYTLWRKKAGARFTYTSTLDEVKANTERRKWYAEPAQPSDQTSQWLTAPQDALTGIRKVMGKAEYVAREGANTGGANAVYWLEKRLERPDGLWLMRNLTEGAKRQVKEVVAPLEPDLLYPLLRGRDVQRWQATPSGWILVPRLASNPSQVISLNDMQLNYPKVYEYLKRFESDLRARKDLMTQSALKRGEPFYFYGAVNTYSFAPWKVVWREVANLPDAAVIGLVNGKPVVPAHTVVLIDCNDEYEAHFVCALINSSPAQLVVQSYIVLHPDPHILDNLRIPRYNPAEDLHRRLAELSKEAHACAQTLQAFADLEAELGREKRLVQQIEQALLEAAGQGAIPADKQHFVQWAQTRQRLRQIEAEIDRLAAQLWGLTEKELQAVQHALQTLAGEREATDGESDD